MWIGARKRRWQMRVSASRSVLSVGAWSGSPNHALSIACKPLEKMVRSLPSIVKQITAHLLPIPVMWWLLVLCGCPKGIAVGLACFFAVGMWFLLWTAIEWHDYD